ncbi:MAG: cytochrome C oxidase subunit II [Archangium gephyra]|uniref:cytochrome-c oxidase n=1 Tax=Archangium gephyra TaxID=48 RepID=A0A2W5VRP1_9BACT|nr:MAG: cytochrome C oxidase subunit II [Archangium gephyra]
MIDKYVESASTFSGDIDHLILIVTGIVGFWWLLAEAVFFYFIVRYTAQEGVRAKYVAGEDAKEKRWVAIPHYATLVFDVFIIVSAIRVWQEVKQTMPQADATVRVIAQQWAWTFVHPGADGKLDTADDIRLVDELHVEKGKTYHFELQSRDVLHSFSIPVFRLKQDIVPGRTIRGWFKATQSGGFDIQCTEICGIGHALMPARVLIHTSEDYAAWVLSQTPATAALTPSATEQTGGMR